VVPHNFSHGCASAADFHPMPQLTTSFCQRDGLWGCTLLLVLTEPECENKLKKQKLRERRIFSAIQRGLAEITRIIHTLKFKHRQKHLESLSFTLFFQIIILL